MPRANPILTNFTGGELGPYLKGRVDTAKYQNGAETIENFIVLPQGGVTKRYGLKFAGATKTSTEKSFLYPFIYNADQAYVLEFGVGYIRFFTNGGALTQTPQAITDITKANPAVVTYTGADTYANGDRVLITGVVGMTEVNNREFTVAGLNAGANTFQLSGINSSAYGNYSSGGTVAEIVEVATTFTESELPDLSFTQSADVLFIAHGDHPTKKLVRNSATNWTLSDLDFLRGPWLGLNKDQTIGISANAATGSVTLTASADVFNADHVGALWKLYTPTRTNGEVEFGADTSVDNGEFWSYNGQVYKITSVFGGTFHSQYYTPPTHKQGTLTLYSFGDITRGCTAKFLHQGFGVVEISAVAGATSATATVYSGYGYTELPPQMVSTSTRYSEATKFWQEGAWSEYRGYAQKIGFFEQRFMASKTQTIFGSVSGNYTDFEEGVEDDNAFNYTIGSEQVDVIRWISPGKQLVIGTTSGEYVMSASSNGEAVTPKNIKISRETSYGSAPSLPVRIGSSVIYMQRRGDPANPGRKVREMAYDYNIDGYSSADLTVFSPHITGDGVNQLAYQADPHSLLWGVKTDGTLCSMTYERGQEVLAWHRHIIGGSGVVESVAVIPGDDGDELWLQVKRTIAGSTVRYIEVMTQFLEDTAKEDAVFLDSAIVYDGTPSATITGLWHLRGETVSVLGDGAVMPNVTVSATGTATLSKAVSKAVLGYKITSKLKTLDIEAGAAAGTAQGKQKRISEVTARMYRSLGGYMGAVTVDGTVKKDRILYRKASGAMDSSPDLFTGDRRVPLPSGWEAQANIYIEHDEPFPFTVLALMPELSTTG